MTISGIQVRKLYFLIQLAAFSLLIISSSGQSFEIIYKEELNNRSRIAKLYADDTSSLFIYNRTGYDSGYATQNALLHNDKGMMISVSDYDSTGQMVYRNFNQKKIKLRQASIKPLNAFTVDDEWISIQWQVDDSFQLVNNYKCTKARGFFRGRNYTVWFTQEIPKPYGPWKLFGLPGTILEAYDDDGIYHSRILEINNKSSYNAAEPVENEHKSMREYVSFLDHIFENAYKEIKRRMSSYKGIRADNPVRLSTVEERRQKSHELYYEWEKPEKPAPAIKILKQ